MTDKEILQKEKEMLERIRNKADLTKEELQFMYSIHSHIEFYETEQELALLRKKRNRKEDLATIFECSVDQIGTLDDEDELYDGKEFVYFEAYDCHHIVVDGQKQFNQINFPDYVRSNIDIKNVDVLDNKKLPRTVKGGMYISHITGISNLVFPENVTHIFDMGELKLCKNVVFPKNVYSGFTAGKLTYAEDTIFPEYVQAPMFLNSLKRGKNVVFPKTINKFIVLTSLESLDGITIPEDCNYRSIMANHNMMEQLKEKCKIK